MSESDWKVIKDALDMWQASQVAIRSHVQLVREATDRLYETRQRDSELILRLAKERNDARDGRAEDQAECVRLHNKIVGLETALRNIKVWAEAELREGPPELGLIVGEASRALGT